MKFKLALVALIAMFMAGGAFACPANQFDPGSKLNWLITGEGQRGSVTLRASTSARLFNRVATRAGRVMFRGRNGGTRSWSLFGEQGGNELFSFSGVGSDSYRTALADARSMFVPKR